MALDVEQVLAAMERQPQAWIDRADGPAARRELYRPVAQTIVTVAGSREVAAALIELGWKEVKWARAVLEGHCERMPKGQRCDGGYARGPWQVHGWCRRGWALPDGSYEALEEQGRCAVRMLLGKRATCRRGWEGAFSGYAGPSCAWPPAQKRAEEMREVLAFLAQPWLGGAKPTGAGLSSPSIQAQGDEQ